LERPYHGPRSESAQGKLAARRGRKARGLSQTARLPALQGPAPRTVCDLATRRPTNACTKGLRPCRGGRAHPQGAWGCLPAVWGWGSIPPRRRLAVGARTAPGMGPQSLRAMRPQPGGAEGRRPFSKRSDGPDGRPPARRCFQGEKRSGEKGAGSTIGASPA
jgi:hypothetical protein